MTLPTNEKRVKEAAAPFPAESSPKTPLERDRTNPRKVHILVVDDEEMIRDMLQQSIAMAGYRCSMAGSADEALGIMVTSPVDVVITDIKMPGKSGIELLREVKRSHSADVIVITGYAEEYAYETIIELGASDFVGKPFRTKELLVRIKRVLKERSLVEERMEAHKQLVTYSEDLARSITELRKAHADLHESYLDTINRLALAAEYKDVETGDHIIRISRYSSLLAEEIGMSREVVENMRYASPMHDVGKIGIPDRILLKPGKLTVDEFEVMKTHTTIGAKILSGSKAEILRIAHEIAISHHEKWDGTGYPRRLSGDRIPMSGRIVGIADVFDALTSARPYKDPYPVDVAFEIIRKQSGTHFDPGLVDTFVSKRGRVKEIMREINPAFNLSLHQFSWSDREEHPIDLTRILRPEFFEATGERNSR